MGSGSYAHQPVLCDEVIRLLSPLRSKTIVDGTLGLGGHSQAILEADDTVRVVGIDRDAQALAVARQRLAPFDNRFRAIHGNYRDLGAHLDSLGEEAVDGVLLDIGVSSLQIDAPDRGFSFRHDGPLDMRMDPSQPLTAAEWICHADVEEIRNLIGRLGEERFAQRIARAIVNARSVEPLRTTGQLATVVRRAVPRGYERGRIDPATRTFQALRMHINQELPSLEAGLEQGFARLRLGGVLVVISFHSLEDRLVKQFVRSLATDCVCPPQLPECRCHKVSEARILTPRPLRAQPDEISQNPRARSARLRAATRIACRPDAATHVPSSPPRSR